jgi:hypothetical protein
VSVRSLDHSSVTDLLKQALVLNMLITRDAVVTPPTDGDNAAASGGDGSAAAAAANIARQATIGKIRPDLVIKDREEDIGFEEHESVVTLTRGSLNSGFGIAIGSTDQGQTVIVEVTPGGPADQKVPLSLTQSHSDWATQYLLAVLCACARMCRCRCVRVDGAVGVT